MLAAMPTEPGPMQKPDCFSRIFSLRSGAGVTSLWLPLFDVGRAAAANISRSTFLHLPVMPNRCIARMTLTWLQAPRPRWVGGNAPVAAVYSALALPSLARKPQSPHRAHDRHLAPGIAAARRRNVAVALRLSAIIVAKILMWSCRRASLRPVFRGARSDPLRSVNSLALRPWR